MPERERESWKEVVWYERQSLVKSVGRVLFHRISWGISQEGVSSTLHVYFTCSVSCFELNLTSCMFLLQLYSNFTRALCFQPYACCAAVELKQRPLSPHRLWSLKWKWIVSLVQWSHFNPSEFPQTVDPKRKLLGLLVSNTQPLKQFSNVEEEANHPLFTRSFKVERPPLRPGVDYILL